MQIPQYVSAVKQVLYRPAGRKKFRRTVIAYSVTVPVFMNCYFYGIMKTKKIYIVLLLAFASGSMQLHSQVVEKEIDGTVFVFDYAKGYAENKNNQIEKLKEYNLPDDTCRFGIQQTTPLSVEFQKVFSKERAKELQDENIVGLSFILYCDSAGFVREVIFMLKNTEKIKLVEFKKMEDVLKNYRFVLTGEERCKEKKYYKIICPVRYRSMYRQ
jgi:hypothetical protein